MYKINIILLIFTSFLYLACLNLLDIDLNVPILGVCLGHQGIASVLGGEVVHAPRAMHGRISNVHHDGNGIFANIPSPFAAVR